MERMRGIVRGKSQDWTECKHCKRNSVSTQLEQEVISAEN